LFFVENAKSVVHSVIFFVLKLAELGASLFEIAKSLFALERSFILGAMALNKNKSEERERTEKIQILSGSLMSDIRLKERRKNG